MNETMKKAIDILQNYKGETIRIMEVCGTHTHEIFRQGIRSMLPENISLISGPGCPVCVTPVEFIDEAIFLAQERGCTIATFGDLIRVPGSHESLADARTKGAKIEMMYTPTDAVSYAKEHPEEDVVFLSVGFETTTPASCIAVRNAREEGLRNFSILTANKTMDQAYRSLVGSADAFLYPGHVSAITGTGIYEELKKEGISGVVAGFSATELLTALALIVRNVPKKEPFFVNAYPRVVSEEGSPSARRIVGEMMRPVDSTWRGLGTIPMSGMELREEYSSYDARRKYEIPAIEGKSHAKCRCGEVLRGACKPNECPLFGKACTPESPVGACMVSNEGACSAFYQYSLEG